jgi:hypothetical protein
MKKRWLVLTVIPIGVLLLAFFWWPVRSLVEAYVLPFRGAASVEDIVNRYELPVKRRLEKDFERAKLSWPVRHLRLVALKAERRLEMWASDDGVKWIHVKDYPVLAASGGPGPKLREGDEQVPEGLYRISYLNPNSRFHLSLKVNYPNENDERMAQADRRTRLGGDIFIHGGFVSIGCLAIGDPAIEEVFVTAAKSKSRIAVLITPRDFRVRPLQSEDLANKPRWIKPLYQAIAAELARL